MKKTEIAFAAVVLVLAAVVGGLIGDIVGSFLPEKAAVKTLFEKSIDIGLKSFNWELYTISFTFGLMVKINFVSILMIILVIAYFKWWHL